MNTQNELDRIVRDWLEDRVAEPRQAGLDARPRSYDHHPPAPAPVAGAVAPPRQERDA